MSPIKVRFLFILVLILSWKLNFSGNADSLQKNELPRAKYLNKNKLAHMIDSLFDQENMTIKDIDKLNYYASLLMHSKCDSVRISEFNLAELSFYSQSDEKLLFPTTQIDSIPSSFNLVLENDYLSYYFPPIKGIVTSNYGWRDGRMHKGIDVDLNKGDKVAAAFDGKVRFARKQGGFGNVVIIMHPNGLETVYAHLSRIKVKEGQVVLSGQIIGLGGNTGHSYGSHLHFELRYKGHALNPAGFISFTDNKLYHHTITIRNSKHTLSAFPSNCLVHTVARGESWNMIALKYGLSTKELLSLNGVAKRYYLKPGQQLRIN